MKKEKTTEETAAEETPAKIKGDGSHLMTMISSVTPVSIRVHPDQVQLWQYQGWIVQE